MLEPIRSSDKDAVERTKIYRQLASEFADRLKVPIIDCHGAFEKLGEKANGALFTDNIHLSRAGHIAAAKEIFKILIEQKIPEELRQQKDISPGKRRIIER